MVRGADHRFVMREADAPYHGVFAPEKIPLSPINTYFWDDLSLISDC
jgi:hypothetical protein